MDIDVFTHIGRLYFYVKLLIWWRFIDYDRISMLPDSLLLRIISSFLPIEDAIKTDVLNAAEEFQLQFGTAWKDLCECDRFVLPQLLFTNPSFTELRFSLRSSPVLENLELYHFYGLTRLHAGKASLKKLIFREFWDFKNPDEVGMDDERSSGLEISAPNLQSLEILGYFGRSNCQLADVSCLVDATLDCDFTPYYEDRDDGYQWHQNVFRGLLESLAHVKNLTLGAWALQILSTMETNGLCSPLSKCECLTLDTAIRESVLPGIASILESCSHLVTLVIITSLSSNGLNASVLQKMVVNMLMVDDMVRMDLFQAAQKFLSFPRSYPDVVVMFN
ncbi:hypothetical protein ACSBR1_006195 [Camellia fascicularis]